MISRRNDFFKIVIVSFFTSMATLIFIIVVLAGYFARISPIPQNSLPETKKQEIVPPPQQIRAEAGAASFDAAAVVQNALPGVVGISTLKTDGRSIFDRDATTKLGVGSGIIVNSNGYIITNYHVAGGSNKKIIISFANGRNYEGAVLWGDPVIDIAIVKIDAENIPNLPMGDASTLKVGEPVIAIGNPFGLQLQGTVTSGIISALNRTIKIDTDKGTNFMEDLIQTDASINPGNSGGPLINSKGEVIGVNTIKVTSAEAIGFAIPINLAKPIVNKLINDGKFTEPYLGIFAYDRQIMPFIDLNVKLDKGIYIANIDNDSAAFKSGIRQKDIVIQIDGKDVNTMAELRAYIYSKNPGDVVNITKASGGNVSTVPVKLTTKTRDGLITR